MTCWSAARRRAMRRSARRWPATCAGAPDTRRSWTRSGWRLTSALARGRPDDRDDDPGLPCRRTRGRRARRRGGPVTDTTVLSGCAVVTVDAGGTEYPDGHLVLTGGRIAAVGAGPAPDGLPDARYVDARGCLATPGLVNTHHHL